MQADTLHITFLGTGTSQGIPVIGCDCAVCLSSDHRDKRLRCSVLIQSGDYSMVIDAGPDFRQQMLRAKVNKLDAVLITHEHNDHIIGLDDVRPFNFKYSKDMPVYATARVQEQLKQRFSYIFSSTPYPGAPMIRLHSIAKDQAILLNDLTLIPIEVRHGGLPVLGFRIRDFTYLTDVKTISEEEKEKIKGTKILVINALHHKEHHSHLNLEQALDLIDELAPEQAYLTHISHNMGTVEHVSPTLPSHVSFAYDELKIEI